MNKDISKMIVRIPVRCSCNIDSSVIYKDGIYPWPMLIFESKEEAKIRWQKELEEEWNDAVRYPYKEEVSKDQICEEKQTTIEKQYEQKNIYKKRIIPKHLFQDDVIKHLPRINKVHSPINALKCDDDDNDDSSTPRIPHMLNLQHIFDII